MRFLVRGSGRHGRRRWRAADRRPHDGPVRSLLSRGTKPVRPHVDLVSRRAAAESRQPSARFVEAPRASRWSPVAVCATLYGHRTRNYLCAFFTGPSGAVRRRGNVAHGAGPRAACQARNARAALRSPTLSLVNPTRAPRLPTLPRPLLPFSFPSYSSLTRSVGERAATSHITQRAPQPGPVAAAAASPILPPRSQGRLRCASPVTISRATARVACIYERAAAYILRVALAEARLSFALRPPFTV